MQIVSGALLQARLPLTEPYPLSFTTVTNITSIVVILRSDRGTSGVGEAVPLPGYSEETARSVIDVLQSLLPLILGLDNEAARELVSSQPTRDAFALSAVATALDLMTGEWTLPKSGSVPTLAPLSVSAKPDTTVRKARELVDRGFRTLKLKVGRDVEADRATTRELLNHLPKGIRLRIDANQAYSLAQARRLIDGIISHPRIDLIEHLEQPFGVHKSGWRNHGTLAGEMDGIELMLDEFIFGVEDIVRAADLGVSAVKLKLSKHQGPNAVMNCGKAANSCGMKSSLAMGSQAGLAI